MENEHPLVSVIIPIYNVEDYLTECISSITGQTYRNLEIICVNDGSTDNSNIIMESYQREDKRVIYLQKENGGLSSARNLGLKHATGEYIVFVDSDDVLKLFAIDKMIKAIQKSNADILVFGAELFPKDESSEHERIVTRYLSPPNRIYSGREITEYAIFEEESCNIFAWNKMYKASLFHNGIVFPEAVKLGEDRCFLFDIFPCAECICIRDMKIYRYRQKRASSLTGLYTERQLERARWKIVILEYIFTKWFNNEKISKLARENLIMWSTNYIERSVQGLSESECSEIKVRFNTILSVVCEQSK